MELLKCSDSAEPIFAWTSQEKPVGNVSKNRFYGESGVSLLVK